MNKLIVFFFFLISSSAFSQNHWKAIGSSSLNRAVRTLFPDSVGNQLLIGGEFKFYDTIEVNGVVGWDGYQFNKLDCGLGGCSSVSCGGVLQFERFKNELYSLFYEDSIGCQRIHHVAKWNGSNWISLSQEFFNGGSSIGPYSLSKLDSVLIVAGGFDSIVNHKAHGIAKYDGNLWDTAFYCNLFTDNYLLIHPFINYHSSVYAQNFLFDTLGHEQFFSVWNGSCWDRVGNAFSNRNGPIFKMIVFDNELYIAGAFSKSRDSLAPGNGIARWNGSRWDDLRGGVRLNSIAYLGAITDMAIFNNELYVVGAFENAGSVHSINIAKWTGSRWCGVRDTFDAGISNIAFLRDTLFIAGNFHKINSDSINYLAKLGDFSIFDTCEVVLQINEANLSEVKIYPNPTTDIIAIESNDPLIEVSLFDLLGRRKFSKFYNGTYSDFMDLRNFDAGTYIIFIKGKNANFFKKIIKQP